VRCTWLSQLLTPTIKSDHSHPSVHSCWRTPEHLHSNSDLALSKANTGLPTKGLSKDAAPGAKPCESILRSSHHCIGCRGSRAMLSANLASSYATTPPRRQHLHPYLIRHPRRLLLQSLLPSLNSSAHRPHRQHDLDPADGVLPSKSTGFERHLPIPRMRFTPRHIHLKH